MIKSTLTAIAILAASTSAALAGSYSSNTYIDGWERGTRNVDVTNVRTETGHVNEFSSSLKLNTDFPNANGYIKFDGKLSGRLDVSTRLIDPSVVGGYSEQVKNYGFTDITTTNITENVRFYNDIYTHKLESGSN